MPRIPLNKNVVQDVIPPKRSIRNIELPSRATRGATEEVKPRLVKIKKVEPAEEVVVQDFTKPVFTPPPPPSIKIPSSYTYEYDEPKKSKKKLLYVSSGLLLVALAFGVSAFFKSAEIRVTPIQDTKTLNTSFTAKKDATGNDLGFQVVTVSKDVTKTVPGTSEQKVETKASGTIVIYNNYSTASQVLVATTRFETPEGLVFRIVSPVTVPGKQTKDGKVVAGSVEATVVADAVGDKYNIGLKDFTIPGFRGDPKYTQVYGRSKTEMSGGFSGMQKVVSKGVVDSANSEMQASLRDTLSKDITSQIPANFVLYGAGISYTFSPVTQIKSADGNAVLQKKGTSSGIIFDRSVLSKAIFAKLAPELGGGGVKIANLDSLQFVFASSTSFNPATSMTMGFSLKGDAHLVWTFDENKLKSSLLGLSKKNAQAVIATYKAIKEAWVTTRPFWNQTIPLDPAKVTFINTLAQ